MILGLIMNPSSSLLGNEAKLGMKPYISQERVV
jgi:hypothetical protein